MARPSHQWDISGVKHMKIENEDIKEAGSMAMIVDPMEAERFVESLKKFSIDEIGTSSYLQQVSNYIEITLIIMVIIIYSIVIWKNLIFKLIKMQ